MFSKNTEGEVCVLLKMHLFPHCLQAKMKMPSPARCFPGSQPPSPGLSILNLALIPQSHTLCPVHPYRLLPGLDVPPHLHLAGCPASLTHHHRPIGQLPAQVFLLTHASCSLFRLS